MAAVPPPSAASPPDLDLADVASLPRYTMVELPVIARSLSTATDFFGGAEAIRFAIQTNAPQLAFRPPSRSPLSAPLLGRKEKTCALLIRVVRNKRTGATRVEAVGRVTSLFRYSDPADYQFLPSPHDDSLLATPPIPFSMKHIAEPQPLFQSQVEIVLGKVMSQEEMKSWNESDAIRYIPEGGTQKVKQRAKSNLQAIRFGDPVPQETLAVDTSHRRSSEAKVRSLLTALEAIFASWPIITRRALSTVELFEGTLESCPCRAD